MKHIFIIVSFICFVQLSFGQNKDYTITFNKNSFEIATDSGGYSRIRCKEPEYFFQQDTLLPALPYKSIRILLSDNSGVSQCNASILSTTSTENINLINNPTAIPTSVSALTRTNGSISYAADQYPASQVVLKGVYKMQGYTFAEIDVCPFVYNAKEKKLIFIDSMTISLTTVAATSTDTTIRKEFDEIKSLFINPTEAGNLYSQTTNLKSASSSAVDTVEYLIVTADSLVKSFLPLKAWKIQRGIRTEIISTEAIYANYSGATNQLKIKACLKDYYDNKNLKWVLLGGDNTIVPDQDCYIQYYSYTDATAPTDLFYACFDNTFNWDYDGDGIVGETTDNIDPYPEVYISRAPIRTSEHIKAFIDKTLYYEKLIPSSNYVNSMLLAGTQLGSTWNGQSDAQQKSENMYSNYILPYNSSINRKRFYDTATDFTGGADYNLTASNLVEQLNNGYHFVHLATHGNCTVWGMEVSPNFSSTNASSLTNCCPSIITTMACITNAFDYSTDPCLSEAFIRNPNGGAVTYWGSSRYGWYYQGTSALGPSFILDATFYKNLFQNGVYNFGKLTSVTKSQYVSPSYTCERWLEFTVNAIGDPELPIYTKDPQEFSNVTVTQSGTNVTVNTGGVSDCSIALTSIDYGKSYFKVANSASSATFANVTTPFYVTVTKHTSDAQYKPYVFPSDILYIQHFAFNNKAYIEKNRIIAGNNVTSTLPVGDVLINKDTSATIYAYENIKFTPGFSSKNGSTLKAAIITQPQSCASSVSTRSVEIAEENIAVSSIQKQNVATDNISVYPNPASSDITIDYVADKETSLLIDIFNSSGDKVKTLMQNKTIEAGKYNSTFSIKDLEKGTYFIVFTEPNKKTTKTLIKK